MKAEDFTERQRAFLEPINPGTWSYSPPPAPRGFDLSPKLVNLLAEASQAVGALDGIGRHLPNPHLLIGPYLRREAVLSSRIEGTQTGLSQLLLLEVENPEDFPDDALEVRNYVSALEMGIEMLPKLPLSLRFVCNLHARLMGGARGSAKVRGEFRRIQNFVAPRGATIEDATFVPPTVARMEQALADWESFLHRADDIPLLVRCAWMHFQFETIHPFIDGNGRVGRLLIPLLLMERRALSQPLLYVSAYLERNRDGYYEALMTGRLQGNLDPWFELFLKGVADQAREATSTAERLSELRARYLGRFAKSRSASLRRVIDDLFSRAILTVGDVSTRLHVSVPSAQGAIDTLVAAGILREMSGRKWRRIYIASEIFSIVMPEEVPA